MLNYLADAARRSGSPRPVNGIATDGATFIAYQLLNGRLTELKRYATDAQRPAELIASDAIVDTKAYWAAASSADEAAYLCGNPQ